MKEKGCTWFFLAVDYALGASLLRDASDVIERLGGKVIGALRFPLGSSDLASFILQAQSSNAKYIGLASVGQDLWCAEHRSSRRSPRAKAGPDGCTVVFGLFSLLTAFSTGLVSLGRRCAIPAAS